MQYAPLLHQNYITCNKFRQVFRQLLTILDILNYFEVHQRALLQIANLSKWPFLKQQKRESWIPEICLTCKQAAS